MLYSLLSEDEGTFCIAIHENTVALLWFSFNLKRKYQVEICSYMQLPRFYPSRIWTKMSSFSGHFGRSLQGGSCHPGFVIFSEVQNFTGLGINFQRVLLYFYSSWPGHYAGVWEVCSVTGNISNGLPCSKSSFPVCASVFVHMFYCGGSGGEICSSLLLPLNQCVCLTLDNRAWSRCGTAWSAVYYEAFHWFYLQ